MPGFDDRAVTLDAPEQLADLGAALSSRTRLAVLAALTRSEKPLHINELARRVGVDASPVRTHLELLLKEGLAREVDSPTGRERFFETSLVNVRLVLEGVNRPVVPKAAGEAPKTVLRLQKKLALIAKETARLEEKARRVNEEIQKAWAAAGRPAAKGRA